MMSNARTLLSAALLVLAVVGAVIEVRAARVGLPGSHRLTLTVYIIVAIYAAASLFLRARRAPPR